MIQSWNKGKNRKHKYKSIKKKKRKGFSGLRKYDVVTDANVDNLQQQQQQQQEGTYDASSGQSSDSSSSEILLPEQVLPCPYVKQTGGRLIRDSIETVEINKDTKANKRSITNW